MKTAVEIYDAKLREIDFQLQSGLINYEQCRVMMSEAFEQAMQMEKEQIMNANLEGQFHADGIKANTVAEQYYNETYGKDESEID